MATISKAVVKSIKQYGEDVREFIIEPEKYSFFDPGTFLQLALEEPKGNRWPDSRNFSMASFLNDDKTIRLVIRKIGVFTTRIFNELNVGSTCYLKYSFGDFLLPFYDNVNPIVCIAGGTGIAPFLSFAEYLKSIKKESRMFLFYSAKNMEELIALNEIKRSIASANLHVYLTREIHSDWHSGRITVDNVVESVSSIVNAHFYICGGEEFTSTFKKQLTALGAENIYTDEW